MPRVKRERFLRVKLDMVNKCQLRCVMCHFAHPDFVETDMEMDRPLLEKVAAELFPRAHDVVLSSSAEPLMAKELPRALELCREYDVPFFHFSTNAMSLTEKIMEKVVEVQMPVLTVSVDGATKETFEKIRTPAKWDKFLSKFALVDRVKQRLGSEYPRLSATCVLMRSNIEEAAQFIRLFADYGVTDVNFVHMGVLGGLGVEDETLSRYPRLSNEHIAEAQQVAKERGIGLMAPLPFPESMYDQEQVLEAPSSEEGGGQAIVGSAGGIDVQEFLQHKNREFNLAVSERDPYERMCYFPWYYIHVNPNGTVFPCGHWFEFTTFGDFRTQSFAEIWTGPQFMELRRQIRSLELRPVCANCTISGMGRPDVLASFSRREKQREKLRQP